MAGAVLELTEETFEGEVASSEVPVLVDFWAPWCAPCRVLGPQVERLATELDGKLKVVKVDVQANPSFQQAHGLSSLPVLLVMVGGKEVARKLGAAGGLAALRQLVAPFVSP